MLGLTRRSGSLAGGAAVVLVVVLVLVLLVVLVVLVGVELTTYHLPPTR